jgi:transposase-like protein
MARPFAVAVTLSEADQATLLAWSRRPKTTQGPALRARIVLLAANPALTNTALAAELGVTTMTVAKWRDRFAAQGLAGLHDEP